MDLSAYLSTRLPTTQDIFNLVNMRTGQAYLSWRLELLDTSLNPIPLPNPPDPTHPNDLSSFIMPPWTTRVNADEDVTRTMTLNLREEPGLQLNTLLHRLQIHSVWLDSQGNELLDVPMGTFRSGLSDRTFSDALIGWNGPWQDLSGKIADKTFWLNEYVPPQGILGTNLISQLMLADPRPLSQGGSGATPAGCDHIGVGWNPALLDLVPSPIALPFPPSWTYKDNQLAALKAITNAINYWPGWNRPNGVQRFAPNPYQYSDPITGAILMPTPDWIYAYGEDSIISGDILVKYPTPVTAKNAIGIVSQNSARKPITSFFFNESVDSLISTLNYGDWVPLVIEDPNIPDQATADRRARIEAQAAGMPQQEISFPAHVSPFLDIHHFLDVRFNANDGTPEIRTDLFPYEVREIETDMYTRESQIRAQRVISLGNAL